MGTEVETLMMAFLFSLVMMDGLDSTLTLFSLASAFSAAMNSLATNVNMLKPTGRTVPPPRLPAPGLMLVGGRLGKAPAGVWVVVKVNLPLRRAHSMARLDATVS